MTDVYHETRGWESAPAPTTERERPDRMSADIDPDGEGAATPPSGDPPKVRARPREGRADQPNSTHGDESGGHSAMSEPMSTPTPTPSGDTDSDETPEAERPSAYDRAKDAAAHWGLDLAPPSFITQPLPPIGDSRTYARTGHQAPATGPARIGAVAFDTTTRPIRWGLRYTDYALARPGRTLVGVAFIVAVVRTVQAVPELAMAVAVIAGAIDAATYYTGIQWLLGLT